MVFLSQGAPNSRLHRRRQLAERFPGCIRGYFLEVMLAKQGAVEAVTENWNYGTSKSREKRMRPSQRVAAQSLTAGPFDSLPLQQVVRFQMQKFIERTISRGLEQSAGIKAEGIGGDQLS